MNTILRFLFELLLRAFRGIDLVLLAALLALMGVGLATLYSASNESTRMLATQGTYFGIGLGALWLASRMPAHVLKQLTPAIYVLSLLPLLVVLFVGSGKYGNHWINLGLFNFQPSELAKLTLPMMLAWHLDRQRLPPTLSVLPMALLIIALPVGLILLQRDLGTAVLVLAAGIFVLFLAGMSWWWFAIAGVVGIGGFSLAMFAPIAWFSFLRPYQQDRILTFRDPENDPMGAGWNILQSKIAIGGGGFSGKGWTEGTQAQLGYLPRTVAHNDFIFSVIAEEKGFLGSLTVLGLFGLVLFNGIRIAGSARDRFGTLIAIGVTVLFTVHVFVNIAMTIGLVPITGIPLPFISYGGSFVLSCCLLQGLVQSVWRFRKDFA